MDNMNDKGMGGCGGNCGCGGGSKIEMMHARHQRHGKRGIMMLLGIIAAIYLGIIARNALKAYDYIGRPTTQRDTISISGEGKVTAVPDIATVSIGVQTLKGKVSDAQAENTKKMNDIIDKLKSMGIASGDIKTSSYNIWPQVDYVNGVQVQRGYTVSQSVDVKVRKLDIVGDVLSASGALGANQIGGVNFTIDDPEKTRQEARLKALEAAKAKAKALADAAGVKLGHVVGFSESVSGGGPVPMFLSKADAAGGLGGGTAPTVEPGSQDVIVDVTVNYEILP